MAPPCEDLQLTLQVVVTINFFGSLTVKQVWLHAIQKPMHFSTLAGKNDQTRLKIT